MGETILVFLIDCLAYGALIAYESLYEPITDRFSWNFEVEERCRIRNVLAVLVLCFDVWFFFRMKNRNPDAFSRILLMCAVAVLFVMHIAASICALLKNVKAYKVMDVAAWFVRFIPVGLVFIKTMLFEKPDDKIMVLELGMLGLLVFRACRMLNGNWMELRIDDIEER